VLRAPVDGTVQQLAVHTVGGVVTPAQQLMMIVPADSRVEVEAMIQNKDIGFVALGQNAEVKVDTFNFTRYGLLHGEVTTVSQDAIVREKPADKSNPSKSGAALSESSEPQGQEFLYAARIALERTQMQIDDKLVDLAPGMAVTVEITTGRRRIIEYLLSPLLRYKQETLRER
jgi:hemolysin D